MISYFSQGNENFDKSQGRVLLPDSCVIKATINEDWTLTMTHPIDSLGMWKYIEENGVLKVPSFNGTQLFRIKNRTKDPEHITVTAEPIFLDAMDDCFLLDVRPTDKTGQEALDLMLINDKYSGESDIEDKATAYYECKNFVEALNGSDDNAFTSRWGGEILYDNYTVIVNEQIGEDNDVEIRYGKNILEGGISEEIDMQDVVTRIVPKSYNGHMLGVDTPWVDSPLIDAYPTIHYSVISYEDVKLAEDVSGDPDDGDIICDSLGELRYQLRRKCKKEFDEGIDRPSVTLSVNIALLKNIKQYEEYDLLEDVSLGDTVHLIHNRLGIQSDERITSLEYDCIGQKVSSVTIGSTKKGYFNQLSDLL